MENEILATEQLFNTLSCDLGPALTSVLTGASRSGFRRAALQVDSGAEARLRTAYEVFTGLAAQEGPSVARAWMIGMNPHLEDQSPIAVLAQDRYADVLLAARCYLNENPEPGKEKR